MPITDNQLKGNWGEQYISSVLASQGCLVRHVSQGTDTGIDLYCERVKDGNPYLHFWCQVKTQSKWDPTKEVAQFNPNLKHIGYWSQQPVPVLIFLVPDGRDKEFIAFFICSYFFDGYKRSKYKISSTSDLTNFLDTDLLIETYLWDLMRGKVGHLKTPHNQYKKSIPKGFTTQYEHRLKTSILWILHRLADDLIFDEAEDQELVNKRVLKKNDLDRVKRSKIYISLLEELVTQTDDKHYHYYETLGKYYELVKNFKMAQKYFKHSLKLLNLDPNKVWGSEITRLKKHLLRINKKNNT